MTMNFNQAVEKRRTYYGISKNKVVSDEKDSRNYRTCSKTYTISF